MLTEQDLANYPLHKKHTKKELQQYIVELAETANPDQIAKLAALYDHFMPPKPKMPKTDFDWVAKACEGKKGHKPQLQLLYSDKGYLIATDGHRMHITNTELQAGYYHQNTVPANETIQYPNWNQVLESAKKEKTMYRLADLTTVTVPQNKMKPHDVLVKLPNGAHLTKKYWEEAISYLSDDTEIFLSGLDFEPVYIRDKNKQAVIMPVKI